MTPSDLLIRLREGGLHPPRILTIAVTGACNLTCSHCWVGGGKPSSPPHLPSPTVLSIVHEFAALGGIGIRFTGGEPLLHPQWLTFLTSARECGYDSLSLQTNGMLLTKESVAALCKLDFPGFSIQISLDGSMTSSHDLVRGEGAFRQTLKGIGLLTSYGLGPRVTLFLTEMRHNLGEIPSLLELAEEMGVGSVVTGALVRCGRGAEQSEIAPPEPEQYLTLLHRFENDQEFSRRYERIGSTSAVEWWRNQAPRQECCTFVENPYLTPEGVLYPCTLCHSGEFSVSGIFGKGLSAAILEGIPLWSTLKQVSRRRATAIVECRACPELATCGGGCMGRAWGSQGNLLAADDRCRVRRRVGEQKRRR